MEPITSYQMMIKHWGKILSYLSTHCGRKIAKGDTGGCYVWIPEILPLQYMYNIHIRVGITICGELGTFPLVCNLVALITIVSERLLFLLIFWIVKNKNVTISV
jgi:hypothetical protein